MIQGDIPRPEPHPPSLSSNQLDGVTGEDISACCSFFFFFTNLRTFVRSSMTRNPIHDTNASHSCKCSELSS